MLLSRLVCRSSKAAAAQARRLSTHAATTANKSNNTRLTAAALATVTCLGVYAFSFSSNNTAFAASAKQPPAKQSPPPPPSPSQSGSIDFLPPEGIPGTNFERTFIAIKPDGVQRGLVAKIIGRFEEKGFQLVALKLIRPTQQLAAGHYEDLSNKPFFPGLVSFFSSGPIVAMIWQGKGVVATGRRLLGETDPAKSAPGSIRGDYSIDIGRNIIHGSDSAEGAKHEVNFWFRPEEVVDWIATQNQHIYDKP